MRRAALPLLGVLLPAASAGGQARPARPTAADSAAIGAALGRWYRVWETRDAALGARDYADDAAWTPLGTRQTTHHRVFVRTDGAWRIASHLISDARDRRQAPH
jgi:hypothetical protein